MTKRIAVIMSVYKNDSVDYFLLAINSILNQTYPCQIFLMQDGNLPTELENVLSELSLNDRVSIYKNNTNLGLAQSLNSLIDLTLQEGYDYIARMDSDDISYNDRLQHQVDFMQQNKNVDVCGTFCREFGASYANEVKTLPLTHNELFNFSITRCPFIHPTVLFKSTVFKKGVRYPTSTHLTEDMALWFDLLSKGCVFANLDKVLLDYRLEESTILRRKGFDKSLSEFKLRFKYMISLGCFSLKNFSLITSRVFFHILPTSFLKLFYKYLR